MKFSSLLFMVVTAFILSGCGGKEQKSNVARTDPAFMFWCFRKEVVSDDFTIPEMKTTAAATYIQNRLKTVPGYTDSTYNLANQTMTVSYQSSTVRKMNFEEAIALSGFAVNHRPASSKANIPAGVKK